MQIHLYYTNSSIKKTQTNKFSSSSLNLSIADKRDKCLAFLPIQVNADQITMNEE